MAKETRFLGVKIIRFGYSARTCLKVVRDGTHTYALLKNGSVALSDDRFFSKTARLFQFGRHTHNRALAEALYRLGCIDNATFAKHSKECAARESSRDQQHAADELGRNLATLGIKPTPEMAKLIKKARS